MKRFVLIGLFIVTSVSSAVAQQKIGAQALLCADHAELGHSQSAAEAANALLSPRVPM